jgi:membrane protein implicated in regulation of membrane protease activity
VGSTKRLVALFLALAVSLGGVVVAPSASAAVTVARCSTTGSVKDASKINGDLKFRITTICVPGESSKAYHVKVRGNLWRGTSYTDLGVPSYRRTSVRGRESCSATRRSPLSQRL